MESFYANSVKKIKKGFWPERAEDNGLNVQARGGVGRYVLNELAPLLDVGPHFLMLATNWSPIIITVASRVALYVGCMLSTFSLQDSPENHLIRLEKQAFTCSKPLQRLQPFLFRWLHIVRGINGFAIQGTKRETIVMSNEFTIMDVRFSDGANRILEHISNRRS